MAKLGVLLIICLAVYGVWRIVRDKLEDRFWKEQQKRNQQMNGLDPTE